MAGLAPESQFVGRVDELRRAGEVLDDVARGSARVVAVLGEPGIGKTRLLAQLGAMAEERGQLVLAGRAAEFERDLPFGVFVDALDEHLRQLTSDKIQRLGRELHAELGQLFPSLASFAGDSVAMLHDERYRAHRAVRDLLERLAGAAPLVLVLDDLHWADPASVELLSALLRRPPNAPVLIAVSLRPRQADPLLGAVIEDATRQRLLVRLELDTLTLADTKDLLSSSLAPSLCDSVYAQAGGNPFYLEALARMARGGAGAVTGTERDVEAGDDVAVPSAVLLAVAHELSLPTASARQLLRGAAAAALDEDASLAALDELVARDLVRATNVPRRCRFRHPLLRRAVYDAAPIGWRLRAHERAASALAVRGAGAAARAHHVEQCARVGDLDAVALLSEAGKLAMQRAPGSAARWFAAALRLLPEEGVALDRRTCADQLGAGSSTSMAAATALRAARRCVRAWHRPGAGSTAV